MWVDTGQRLVNVTDADKIEILREISDVGAGNRDVWIYSLTATFGDRVENLVSVTTYPPRDAQALDDFTTSVATLHSRKARPIAAWKASIRRTSIPMMSKAARRLIIKREPTFIIFGDPT